MIASRSGQIGAPSCSVFVRDHGCEAEPVGTARVDACADTDTIMAINVGTKNRPIDIAPSTTRMASHQFFDVNDSTISRLHRAHGDQIQRVVNRIDEICKGHFFHRHASARLHQKRKRDRGEIASCDQDFR